MPGSEATARRRDVTLAGFAGDRAAVDIGRSDDEPAVRASALAALARMGGFDLAAVTSGAADPSPVVRARTAELAAAVGRPAAGSLVSLLADPAPTVVEAACFGLGEIGGETGGSGRDGPGGDQAVIAGLGRVAAGHGDPLCREAAVAALGAIGDPDGLSFVLGAMTDKPAVRRRAVLALAAFEGTEVDAALEAALADRDWQVRQAAEDLTGRLD